MTRILEAAKKDNCTVRLTNATGIYEVWPLEWYTRPLAKVLGFPMRGRRPYARSLLCKPLYHRPGLQVQIVIDEIGTQLLRRAVDGPDAAPF